MPRRRFRNVVVTGSPEIGANVSIGDYSEVNAKGTRVVILDGVDIASFVAINGADSHLRCIGIRKDIVRRPIVLGENVFIGSHSFVGGGFSIGHHSVLAAGTILSGDGVAANGGVREIPPYSLVFGNPWRMIPGHYVR